MTLPSPDRDAAVPPAPRAFVRSYGCQSNAHDGERVGELLAARGYVLSDSAQDADVVVLNTCHIRERAAEKVFSELGRLRAARRGLPRQTVVVAGCVAQAQGAEVARRAPGVDVVLGPQAVHRLPELLAEAARPGRRGTLVDLGLDARAKFAALPPRAVGRGPSAFLAVQEGCDKFCAFCVVPYTRGAEVSRPVAALLGEAERLVEGGARELVLVGQNVNAYHGEDRGGRSSNLARLLERLAALPGLARLRYTTSHPRDMDDELIAAHATNPKLMPHLHLPVQSGSDRVLAAMNRGHGRSHYLALIARLRAARPDMAFSSDFIVGFPGETEAEFGDTLALVHEVGFGASFAFKYSPRPGTPAASLAGQVPEPVKSERLARLQAALDEGRRALDLASLGREEEVLVEGPGRAAGQLTGKTPRLQAVWFDGAGEQPGDIVRLRLAGAGPASLYGVRPGPCIVAAA